MKLLDIIVDHRTGRISNAKLASATAYLTMTFWFCWHNYHTGFIAEMWYAYAGLAGIAAAHRVAGKMTGQKASADEPTGN